MKLTEILETERERATLKQCCVVHLVQEGLFYRAYEWSAWLSFRYIKQFKATHRRVQKNAQDTMVFVGFPTSSLEKYTPEGASVQRLDDNRVQIVLPETVFEPQSTAETLADDFENWKQSVPLTENSKKQIEAEKFGIAASDKPLRLTDIMHTILSYPIEQRSPLESMAFLADVKQQISKIL